MDTHVTAKTVYRGKIITLEVAPMPEGDFGQVDLGQDPMEITINSKLAPSRQIISGTHEVLHVLFELHKIDATHEQLHGCSVTLATEGLPALNALKRHLSAGATG